MAKKEKKTPKVNEEIERLGNAIIFIEGKEYEIDKLLDEQKILINHISDLDNKLNSAKFNVAQMQFGRDAFYEKLKNSLNGDK